MTPSRPSQAPSRRVNSARNATMLLIASLFLFAAVNVPAALAQNAPAANAVETKTYKAPVLSIDIPTVSLSDAVVEATGHLDINFLGEYITGLYKYLIGFATLVAIVMVMIGGIRYVIAAGSPGQVENAKKQISNALNGLVLLLLVYVILFTVNPKLAMFKSLSIMIIPKGEFVQNDDEDMVIDSVTNLPEGFSTITDDPNIQISKSTQMRTVLVEPFKKAAAAFHQATGEYMQVSSAYRSKEAQLSLFYSNCFINGGSCSPDTCLGIPSSATHDGKTIYTKAKGQPYKFDSSFSGMSQIDFVATLAPYFEVSLCPHTSGVAIDVWCSESYYGGFIFGTDCQVALMKAMKDANFCRLSSEVWHFELEDYKVCKSACKLDQDPWTFTKNGEHNFSDCIRANGKKWQCFPR